MRPHVNYLSLMLQLIVMQRYIKFKMIEPTAVLLSIPSFDVNLWTQASSGPVCEAAGR